MDVISTSRTLPGSLLSASDGSIGIEGDVDRCLESLCLGILTILMTHELIVACNVCICDRCLGSNRLIGDGLTVKLEWSCHQPALIVEEELMNTHLMTFATIAETSVINHERTILLVNERRVVTLCKLSTAHGIPLVTAKEQYATVVGCGRTIVHLITLEESRCAIAILVRTIRILRTEDAHLVTAIAGQATIAHEEEVVLAYLLNIACLARYVISTRYLLAEVRVAGAVGTGSTRSSGFAIHLVREGIGIVAETIGLIQLNHKDTTRPGSIAHPEIVVVVIKDTWVDAVWPIGAPTLTYLIAGRKSGFASGDGIVGMLPVIRSSV